MCCTRTCSRRLSSASEGGNPAGPGPDGSRAPAAVSSFLPLPVAPCRRPPPAGSRAVACASFSSGGASGKNDGEGGSCARLLADPPRSRYDRECARGTTLPQTGCSTCSTRHTDSPNAAFPGCERILSLASATTSVSIAARKHTRPALARHPDENLICHACVTKKEPSSCEKTWSGPVKKNELPRAKAIPEDDS